MNTRNLLIIGTMLFGLSHHAFAQDTQDYVYATGYERGVKHVYVSDRVTSVARPGHGMQRESDLEIQNKRWHQALLRQDVTIAELNGTDIGTAGGIAYHDEDDAETARLEFIAQEKRSGWVVTIVPW